MMAAVDIDKPLQAKLALITEHGVIYFYLDKIK